MSISTSIPKLAGPRRFHLLAAIAAIAAVLALASWAIATRALYSGTHSVRSTAPAQTPAGGSLTPQARQYVLGIASMTPVEVAAAFNSSQPSLPSRKSANSAHAPRSGAPSLAAVLRSLTPRERRYVLGIASLTPLQVWAAFGTSPTPPVSHGGSASAPGGSRARSASSALPILPACGPGPCWHGATSTGRDG